MKHHTLLTCTSVASSVVIRSEETALECFESRRRSRQPEQSLLICSPVMLAVLLFLFFSNRGFVVDCAGHVSRTVESGARFEVCSCALIIVVRIFGENMFFGMLIRSDFVIYFYESWAYLLKNCLEFWRFYIFFYGLDWKCFVHKLQCGRWIWKIIDFKLKNSLYYRKSKSNSERLLSIPI